MQQSFLKFIIALILALLLSWAYLFIPQTFQSIDSKLRDFLFIIRGELPKTNNIVIVDIDEKALDKFGQWPWSRNIFADLLYKLTEAKAGIIGLDIVFAEEDRSSPHRFAKKFSIPEGKLENYDKYLAKCFSETPVVGGYTFLFENTKENRTPNIPAVFIEKGLSQNSSILNAEGVVLNIDILQDSLYSSGFFVNIPDIGGMIRNVPLIMKYKGVIYPSLALEMIRIYKGANIVQINGDDIAIDNIEMGNLKIPTDKEGRIVLNPRGAKKHFKYISIADIFDGNFKKEDIEGKFILIGTSAMGLMDLRATSFDNALPGVEIHATVIDNILTGDILQKSVEARSYDLIIIWVVIFVMVLLFSITSSIFLIPLAIIIGYGLFKIFFITLFDYGIVLNLLFPMLAFFSAMFVSIIVDYIISSNREKDAKRMLGKKVSPAVMNYLLEHSKDDLVQSKEIEVTVFFSDIRSFTTISEKIGSPDKLITMLNQYMTPMVDNIISHKGTIDKFIGDAIMAYWNAPLEIKNHTDMALISAIEQIELLEIINRKLTPEYDITIDIGIGIHTGLVTAGDMGATGRSDYTIIGDNVNLASRLEGLTKQYKANILITKASYDNLTQEYKIRPIDLVEVKGKTQAVEIYEVICSNKNISTQEIEEYKEAIKYYREGRVDDAIIIFNRLQESNPSLLYELYQKRCRYFIENRDIKFNPVLKMRTK
ncbi:Adenylate cyclase [hydrothermal vent metagenome]|uniref:Adenylate cyclase n=1 Tax=hydrothermal vent metagenome TaxID=652676 RepID=A0A1W1EJS8_9ZZZZ